MLLQAAFTTILFNMKPYIDKARSIKISKGFSLFELIIAASIGTFVSILTGSIIVDNIKSTARGEALQRLNEDWNRAITLIESEIAISQSLQASGLSISNAERQQCPYLDSGQIKLRINLPGKLPDILYGTKRIGTLPSTEHNQWIGGTNAGVLIRCGPKLTISATGKDDYVEGQDPQESIILDDLDFNTDGGLKVDPVSGDSKLIHFELVMQGNNGRIGTANSNPFQIGSGAFSRINQVQLVPNSQSICKTICTNIGELCFSHASDSVITPTTDLPRDYLIPSKNITQSNLTTICTNRAVEENTSITANDANYVIDASPTPTDQPINSGVTINGGQLGRNILLGTSGNDRIFGGPFDDVIVGRNGNDILEGAGGNDSFLPWSKDNSSNATINGGLGLDSVYLNDNYQNYTLPSLCSANQCNLTGPGSVTLTMMNVEILVFKDTAIRLSDS